MYNTFNGRRFIHVSFRLNKRVEGQESFKANVRAPVQDKVAVIGIFVTPRYDGSNGRRFIYVSFRLHKRVEGQGPFKATVWDPV